MHGLTLVTPRLTLRPVAAGDLPLLIRLKIDPLVFGQMLGGVRAPWQTATELADDLLAWGKFGYGMFAVHEQERFHGIAGVQHRADGRGPALRFAVWPEARGRGIAREAAGAALRFTHAASRLTKIIAVARYGNFASRMVLGGIGMSETGNFWRDGHELVLYESRPAPITASATASTPDVLVKTGRLSV